MSVLAARHLSKRYRSRYVVNDVSLSVTSGEVVGLLGPNGAGKTTSFYMIVGLVRPDGGTIEVNRRDITWEPMHVRARLGVGYLPQEPSVFRKLTVEQNILAILETRPDMDRAERDVRRMEGIIHSMTPLERRKPDLIKATRKRRIAAGAGVQVQEVNRLLNEFDQMQGMMKKMRGGGLMKMMKRMGGMKGMKGMPGMPS